jgi:hypothetical protein
MRNNENRFGVQQQNIQDATPHNIPVNFEQPKDQLSFIVPTEFIDLPSKGKFYPANHPLHKKETLEIKQMTAKEEDILTSRNLLKKGVALDKLIHSLVVDKNINPDSLTIEDRNAILISARITGYGNQYTTQVQCPNCEQKVKHNFDLNEKLPKEGEELSVSTDENGYFSVILPNSKWTVVCRALNGYDEKAILRYTESKKNTSAGDSTLMEQLKMMIVAIENVTDRELIENAIGSMRVADSKFLRSYYQKVVPSIDLNHTFLCSSCGADAVLEVPLTADFFWFK